MNTNQKRQQWIKDLDKLSSGDYVLVPKAPLAQDPFNTYLEDICGIDPDDHDNAYDFTVDGLAQLWQHAQTQAQLQGK